MVIRRLASFASAFVLALTLTVPVVAQDTGASFILNLATCSWLSSTHDVVIADSIGSSPSAYDCSEGWESTVADFTLNGAAPDLIMPNAITWNSVEPGEAELAIAGYVPSPSNESVTINGDTELWATYYLPTAETPDATETVVPTEAVTETPEVTTTLTEIATGGDNVAEADADPTEAAGGTTEAEKLPNTGAGTDIETGAGVALAALAASAVVGTTGLAIRRRK
ncbi:MAG: hypothetical protein QM589_13590 [Thermomicrobiales bacterium]